MYINGIKASNVCIGSMDASIYLVWLGCLSRVRHACKDAAIGVGREAVSYGLQMSNISREVTSGEGDMAVSISSHTGPFLFLNQYISWPSSATQ